VAAPKRVDVYTEKLHALRHRIVGGEDLRDGRSQQVHRGLESKPVGRLHIRGKELDRSHDFHGTPVIDALGFMHLERCPRMMPGHYEIFAKFRAYVYPSRGIDVVAQFQPHEVMETDSNMAHMMPAEQLERLVI
jgi:hypothetical protein